MMEFYSQSTPRARKEHMCGFCGGVIRAGERYSYESGKFDGEMFVRKLCLPCKNILNAFIADNGVGEFRWEWVSEWLADECCTGCGDSGCQHNVSGCAKIRERFEREPISPVSKKAV